MFDKIAPQSAGTSLALSCARSLLSILPRLRRLKVESVPWDKEQRGLTLPQFFILGHLYTGEYLSSRLSRRLMVSMPTITSVVDGLVNRGLVERASEPGDRRQVKLQLTSEGRRIYEEYLQALELRLSQYLAQLTPEQQQRLLLALGDLQQALERSAHEEESEK